MGNVKTRAEERTDGAIIGRVESSDLPIFLCEREKVAQKEFKNYGVRSKGWVFQF